MASAGGGGAIAAAAAEELRAIANGGPHKTVLITGVGRGLGRALAIEMARRGHSVIGFSRDFNDLSSLGALLYSDPEHHHLLFHLDVRFDVNVAHFAHYAIAWMGLPDIIVNCAGTINMSSKIWELTEEEVDNVLDTNVKGIANILRHFVPPMIQRKKGIIVNFSALWGRYPVPLLAPYCASKWAVEGLTKTVAGELPEGLAIVLLNPGATNTEMLTSCYGSQASQYQTPDSWAPKAASLLLNLTAADNGKVLSVN